LKNQKAYEYESVDDIKIVLKKIGNEIFENGLPDKVCPLVVGFTGYGNVSKGAQEILDCFPFIEITPEELNLTEKEKYFKNKFEELKEKYPEYIKEIRVIGLMIGLEVEKNGPEVVKKCIEEGILMNCTAGNVLRFLPPLIVEEKEIDYLIEILDKIFEDITSKK